MMPIASLHRISLSVLLCLGVCVPIVAAPRRAIKRKAAKPTKQPFVPLQLKNKMVFEGEGGIRTMDPDGSNQKLVWNVPKGYGYFGGFSPDGTLALSYNDFNVYLHNLKTKSFRRIFVHSEGWGTFIGSVQWSRDGKTILFEAGGAPTGDIYSTVYRVNVQQVSHSKTPSRGIKNLQSKEGCMHEPSLSLEGRDLIFSFSQRNYANQPFSGNIWIANIDGSEPRQLTFSPDFKQLQSLGLFYPPFDQTPCFNPNGSVVAFVREVVERGTKNIWLVDTQTLKDHCITTDDNPVRTVPHQTPLEPYSNLNFSPKGDVIAFSREYIVTGVENPNHTLRRIGIYLVNITDHKVQRLTDGKLVQWIW